MMAELRHSFPDELLVLKGIFWEDGKEVMG